MKVVLHNKIIKVVNFIQMLIKDEVHHLFSTSMTSYKNNECFKQVSPAICLVKKVPSQTPSFC